MSTVKKEDRLPTKTVLFDIRRLVTEVDSKLASRRWTIDPIIEHLS